jgi:hypothetical protein
MLAGIQEAPAKSHVPLDVLVGPTIADYLVQILQSVVVRSNLVESVGA